MPKRSSKKNSDVNELAKAIVDQATDEKAAKQHRKKNEAAVALGRLGGKKGGPARAAKLSADERSRIARKAAEARWQKEE